MSLCQQGGRNSVGAPGVLEGYQLNSDAGEFESQYLKDGGSENKFQQLGQLLNIFTWSTYESIQFRNNKIWTLAAGAGDWQSIPIFVHANLISITLAGCFDTERLPHQCHDMAARAMDTLVGALTPPIP